MNDWRRPTPLASSSAEPAAAPYAGVRLPGLGELRSAVRYARRRLPGNASLRTDGIAGLSLAVANVPDGMANAVVLGVNPLFGLYAAMVGPFVGGLLSSTRLMVITTTAAASLTATQALAPVPEAEYTSALFLMVLLAGIFQILFGALGLGWLMRFVSYSVTTGFLAGISVLLVISQIPTITGYRASGETRVEQAVDVLRHPGEIDFGAFVIGVLTLALAAALPRTRLRNTGRLAAVIVASGVAALLGMETVRVVGDVGEITGGLPTRRCRRLATS